MFDDGGDYNLSSHAINFYAVHYPLIGPGDTIDTWKIYAAIDERELANGVDEILIMLTG